MDSQHPLEKIPQDCDVVLGRFGGIPINTGTQAYRDMVKRFCAKYRNGTSEEKQKVARNIFTELKDSYGAAFWTIHQGCDYKDCVVQWMRPKGKVLRCFLLVNEKQLIRKVQQSLNDYSRRLKSLKNNPRQKSYLQSVSDDDFNVKQDEELPCPAASSNMKTIDSTTNDSCVSSPWCCLQLHIIDGSSCIPSAYVELKNQNDKTNKKFLSGSDGLDALFKAIDNIIDFPVEFKTYESKGRIMKNQPFEIKTSTTVCDKKEGHIYTGTATSSDIFIGAAGAYLDAVNKVFSNQHESKCLQPVDTSETDAFFMDVVGYGSDSVYDTDISFHEEKWIVDCTQVTLYDVSCSKATGFVSLRNSFLKESKEAICTGDGAIDALIKAINEIIQKEVTVVEYSSTLSSTKGCKDKASISEVEIVAETKIVIALHNDEDKKYFGKAVAKNMIVSFAEAYVSSINKLLSAELQEEMIVASPRVVTKVPVPVLKTSVPKEILVDMSPPSPTVPIEQAETANSSFLLNEHDVHLCRVQSLESSSAKKDYSYTADASSVKRERKRWKRPTYEPKEKEYVERSVNHILCERGQRATENHANKMYLKMIKEYSPMYRTASKTQEKRRIAFHVIEEMKCKGYGFIKRERETQRWYHVTDMFIYKRVVKRFNQTIIEQKKKENHR